MTVATADLIKVDLPTPFTKTWDASPASRSTDRR